MSRKSRWFLGLGCVALLTALAQVVPAIPVGDGVADFAKGFAAAMMVGVLVTWRGHRV